VRDGSVSIKGGPWTSRPTFGTRCISGRRGCCRGSARPRA
jgi:hypothetical protein